MTTTSTMVQWKGHFAEGVEHFRSLRLDAALSSFNQAISLGMDGYKVYDSRAAVYEKLGKTADALRDSKKVIDLTPEAWQGYARAARLFLAVRKYPQSLKMADMALQRVKVDDAKRRAEIQAVKDKASAAQDTRSPRSTTSKPEPETREKINFFGRLPIEIATNIFHLLTIDDPGYPVRLSCVCQHWRRSIRNTPGLWDVLILSSKKPAAKVDLWLRNSKGRLRELHIRHSFIWRLYSDVFQKLRAAKWDTLRVFTTQHDVKRLTDLLIKSKLSSLDRLHRLAIHGEGRAEYVDDPWRWIDMIAVPDIRDLTLDRALIWWQGMCQSMVQLRSLTIVSCIEALQQDGNVLTLLQANPNLEKLHLELTNINLPSYTPTSPLPVVNLPRLRSLTLIRLNSVSDILAAIVAPALEVLSFIQLGSIERYLQRLNDSPPLLPSTAEDNHDETPIHPASRLTELRIQSCGFSARTLVALLHHTPQLATLQMSRAAEVAFVLESLAEPRPSSPSSSGPDTDVSPECTFLCPHLHHIDVSHSGDVSSGPVNRLVASRLPEDVPGSLKPPLPTAGLPMSTGDRIRSIILDGCPRVEVETLPWLREVVDRVSCVYATKKSLKGVRYR